MTHWGNLTGYTGVTTEALVWPAHRFNRGLSEELTRHGWAHAPGHYLPKSGVVVFVRRLTEGAT